MSSCQCPNNSHHTIFESKEQMQLYMLSLEKHSIPPLILIEGGQLYIPNQPEEADVIHEIDAEEPGHMHYRDDDLQICGFNEIFHDADNQDEGNVPNFDRHDYE